MPIGFDAGEMGGGRDERAEGRAAREVAVREAEAAERGGSVAAGAVERGVWAWVEIVRRALVPEVWTRWATVEDERVCPECGPLDGQTWPAGEGPSPPLHVNCRCARVHAFTVWRVRPTAGWALRWLGG
jgi:hypothetical protein